MVAKSQIIVPVDLLQPELVQFPLLFLPTAGCLALNLQIHPRYSYPCVVDTGSPFLTAPPTAAPYLLLGTTTSTTKARETRTLEQYGDTVGEMTWRSTRHLTVYDTHGRPVHLLHHDSHHLKRMEIGIPSRNVLQDTGGVFCGLLRQDANRPTVLQQLGVTAFVLDYVNRLLTLQRHTTKSKRNGSLTTLLLHQSYDDDDSVETLDMYRDFDQYGSNVHHYGFVCEELQFCLESTTTDNIVKNLKRPLVVVLDSGLTGCILSESLRDELSQRDDVALDQVSGARIRLGDMTILTSDPKYWSLASIRLPWFDLDSEHHPHILAAGGTFLCNTRLTIDTERQQARLRVTTRV